MKTSIITIGDELLIGQVVNTNSAWIAARLNDAGARVLEQLTIPDDGLIMGESLRSALGKYDLVITTGGLGPTKDDITKDILCQIFGCGLVLDVKTLHWVEKMLGERGIEMNELNRSQAMLPEKCTVLPNRNGTAPGMWFEKNGKVLVALPGVPFEMRELMQSQVLPRLTSYFGLRSDITHKTIVTYGIPEAELAERLAGWEEALPDELHLAYLPSPTGMRLRLSSYNVDSESARESIEQELVKLRGLIPVNIVGYGDVTLESAVAEMLTQQRQTLAVAESCTGGAISARFTAMSGASAYFAGGAVVYSNSLKTKLLGVEAGDIEQHGAVSETVARQMALGIQRIAGSDYAIAVTGIAGPDGGTAEKPVGTVWIAVAHPDGVTIRKKMFGSLREVNIARAASTAIDMLRIILSGNSVP